ncbi:hypothetical protein H072_9912 [Dactylellina haptotyla CBS 200.50]|uniref:Rhodopsin domain-containing protein n=1 Tax=Dactylellina haptotyla (strain CBS 200.50) TaxID=1284197 RepID=S8BBR8_DACHA|nr:hypothetical protein H072_9912 [Dactylellina haptotyla CBS 200.50]
MGYTTDLKTGAAAEVILPLLATLGVVLRFHIRINNSISIKWDDYLILLSLPLTWALWAIWVYIAVAVVPSTVSTLPLERLSKFLLWLWVHNLINILAVMLIKLSIILFYLRAFATTRKAKNWLYAIFALSIVQFLMRIANLFVSCFPLENTWEEPWSCPGPDNGGSDYLHKLTLVTETFGLITEFILLAYPFPFVWKSHLGASKKLALCVVFFTGFVTCATQAVRIYVLEMYLYHTSDLGRDVTAPTLVLCALFETGLGTFVICLVAIWGPVREYAKGFFGKVKRISMLGSPESTLPVSETRRSRRSCTSAPTEFSGGGTMTSGTSTLVGVDKGGGGLGSPVVNETSGLVTPLSVVEDVEPWGRNIAGMSRIS